MDANQNQTTRIAAYGLIVKSSNILLCRISARVPDFKGKWTLPGGGINFGEDPAKAMIREVKEETGLSVEPSSIAGVDSILTEKVKLSQHSIRVIYHVENIDGELTYESFGSTDKCEWFPFADAFDLPLVGLAETGINLAIEYYKNL